MDVGLRHERLGGLRPLAVGGRSMSLPGAGAVVIKRPTGRDRAGFKGGRRALIDGAPSIGTPRQEFPGFFVAVELAALERSSVRGRCPILDISVSRPANEQHLIVASCVQRGSSSVDFFVPARSGARGCVPSFRRAGLLHQSARRPNGLLARRNSGAKVPPRSPRYGSNEYFVSSYHTRSVRRLFPSLALFAIVASLTSAR